MIKIYVSPSCASCRKVKKWFEEQNIPFEEKNIFGAPLNNEDIVEILTKSENGTEDIISERSKIMKEENIDIENMKISELVDFIRKNPSILKRPIMVDDHRIQVGYNEEEIRTFIPHEARMLADSICCKEKCPQYGKCDHAKDIENKEKTIH